MVRSGRADEITTEFGVTVVVVDGSTRLVAIVTELGVIVRAEVNTRLGRTRSATTGEGYALE